MASEDGDLGFDLVGGLGVAGCIEGAAGGSDTERRATFAAQNGAEVPSPENLCAHARCHPVLALPERRIIHGEELEIMRLVEAGERFVAGKDLIVGPGHVSVRFGIIVVDGFREGIVNSHQ